MGTTGSHQTDDVLNELDRRSATNPRAQAAAAAAAANAGAGAPGGDAGGASPTARRGKAGGALPAIAERGGTAGGGRMSRLRNGVGGARGALVDAEPPRLTAKQQAVVDRQQRADRAQKWFAVWTIELVRKAYERLRERGGERYLTRREFWEAFTDYDAVTDGEFLALPQDAFGMFAFKARPGTAAARAGNGDVVDSIEVLLALTLFCQGDASSQLRLCFEIFDADDNKEMDLDEMKSFFRVLCSMSTKVGILVSMPSELRLVRAAADAMAHADLDGDTGISVEEWTIWARTNVLSKRILHAFNNKSKKQRLRDRARQRKVQGMDQVGKLPDGAVVDVDPAIFTRVATANAVYVAINSVVRLLSGHPHFSLHAIGDLQREFKRRAGKYGTLTRKQFRILMESRYDRLRDGDHMDKIFMAFDVDNSGDVDPKEFSLGLAKCTIGSVADKLDLLFAILDNDGDGTVEFDELQGFIARSSRDQRDVAHFAEALVTALDKDGDGVISFNEFTEALATQPILYQVFNGVGAKGFKEVKQYLKQYGIKFDFKRIKAAWETLQSRYLRTKQEEMDLLQFRDFMVDELGLPPSLMRFAKKMFSVMDADESGTVSLQEVFRVLAQATTVDLVERAHFMFSVYDMDGSGSLSREEIHEMLAISQERTEDAEKQSGVLLKELDTDGDGTISKKEFLAAVTKKPHLLDTFARLFGLDDVSAEDAAALQRSADNALVDKMLASTEEAEKALKTAANVPSTTRSERREAKMAAKQAMRNMLRGTMDPSVASSKDVKNVLLKLQATHAEAVSRTPFGSPTSAATPPPPPPGGRSPAAATLPPATPGTPQSPGFRAGSASSGASSSAMGTPLSAASRGSPHLGSTGGFMSPSAASTAGRTSGRGHATAALRAVGGGRPSTSASGGLDSPGGSRKGSASLDNDAASDASSPSPRGGEDGSGTPAQTVGKKLPSLRQVSLAVHAATISYGETMTRELEEKRLGLDAAVRDIRTRGGGEEKANEPLFGAAREERDDRKRLLELGQKVMKAQMLARLAQRQNDGPDGGVLFRVDQNGVTVGDEEQDDGVMDSSNAWKAHTRFIPMKSKRRLVSKEETARMHSVRTMPHEPEVVYKAPVEMRDTLKRGTIEEASAKASELPLALHHHLVAAAGGQPHAPLEPARRRWKLKSATASTGDLLGKTPLVRGGMRSGTAKRRKPGGGGTRGGTRGVALRSLSKYQAPGSAHHAHSLKNVRLKPTYSVKELREVQRAAERYSDGSVFASLSEEHNDSLLPTHGRGYHKPGEHPAFGASVGHSGVAIGRRNYSAESDASSDSEDEGRFAWLRQGRGAGRR